MSLVSRKATIDDISILEIIRKQALDYGLSSIEKYDRKNFSNIVGSPDKSLSNYIKSDNFLVLVAETEITEVGYIVYDIDKSIIIGLYVSSDHQEKGCGSFLLKKIEKIAAEKGNNTLSINVPYNAWGFFKRKGFEKIKKGRWDDNIETLYLEKTLSCD